MDSRPAEFLLGAFDLARFRQTMYAQREGGKEGGREREGEGERETLKFTV